MKFDESYNQVRDFIIKNSKENKWTPLTIASVQSHFPIPANKARMLIIRLRLDPNMMVKLINSVSRFKPKEFFYSTPENRIKSIKSGIMQFEINKDENDILTLKFGCLLNEKDLTDYLCLVYLCEKFKSTGLHKRWRKLNIIEISKIMGLTETKILDYIRLLQDKKLVVQSPYTLEYRLTIHEEEWSSAQKEVTKQSLNPEYVAMKKANEIMTSHQEDDDKSIITNFKRTLENLLKYNAKTTESLNNQIKLIEGLAQEEQNIKIQKSSLNHLNQEYSKLTTDFVKVKYERDEARKELKLTDDFLKDYHNYIQEETIQMIAQLTRIIEDYFKLPTHMKNNVVNNNKVKVNLTTVMIEYQQKLLCYKKGVDIN